MAIQRNLQGFDCPNIVANRAGCPWLITSKCVCAVTAVKERRRWRHWRLAGGGRKGKVKVKGVSNHLTTPVTISSSKRWDLHRCLPFLSARGPIYAGNDFFWSERSQICVLNWRHTWSWRSEEIAIPLLMQPVPTRHAVINCRENVVPKIVSLKEAVASSWLRQ